MHAAIFFIIGTHACVCVCTHAYICVHVQPVYSTYACESVCTHACMLTHVCIHCRAYIQAHRKLSQICKMNSLFEGSQQRFNLSQTRAALQRCLHGLAAFVQ